MKCLNGQLQNRQFEGFTQNPFWLIKKNVFENVEKQQKKKKKEVTRELDALIC